MIAYNKEYIRNKALLEKAEYWFSKKLLSQEQYNIISKKYISNLYTPALFVRIGLFIFTYILISAALSLYSIFFVMTDSDYSRSFGIFTCLLFAIACFTVLEMLIKNRHNYRSGIDEALLYSALGFTFGFFALIFGDMNLKSEDMFLFYFILALPILGTAVVRYADSFVTLAAAFCLYAVFFLLIMKLGDIAKLIMPFALMLFSGLSYFLTKKFQSKEFLIYWKQCLIVSECIALLVFYLACNYFVIRESGIEFFDMQLAPGDDIPLAFVFYILTALVPLGYVFYGLKNKDKILLWVGLLLVAIAALTFKHYFSLGHPEITLTLAGSIMIIVAYFSIRYLKTPKHGISYDEDKDEDNFLKTNAEALVIAQSFSQQAQPQNDPKFGEGGFGGGGAGSKF